MPSGSAIVFGATGGIGGEIAARLLARGSLTVIGTYRGERKPQGDAVHWVKFDAASPEPDALRTAVEDVASPLRALLYCIGIPSSKCLVVDTPGGEWVSLFQANCLGFVAAYTALRNLCRASGTRVLVLSSDATRTLREKNGAYTSSKAALESVALTLAKEEAPYGVRINALAPSLVDSTLGRRVLQQKGVDDIAVYTQSQPWGRLLTLREVADAAIGMAIDETWSYSTGQVVRLAAAI